MTTDAANGATERAKLPQADADGRRAGRFADLGARIASAAVLAPLGVGAALTGGPWLAGACGAACVAMSWEWARMSEPGGGGAFWLALAGSLGAVLLVSLGLAGWGLAWLLAAALLSGARRADWRGRAEAALGALYVGAPCALFLWLRATPEAGLGLVLFLFAVIWTADSFAYLGGVLIGGPKLHPALSPQKTWSGLVCGAGAGAGASVLFGALWPPAEGGMLLWGGLGFATASLGLAGDLFESHLKRRFGVKDASGLIPGHGGVLDRIDGLMAVTLASSALLAVRPSLAALFGGAP